MSNGGMYLRLSDAERDGKVAVKAQFEQLLQEIGDDSSKMADLGVVVRQKIIDNWISRCDDLLCLYLMLEDQIVYYAKNRLEGAGYHSFCETMNWAEKKTWMLEVYHEC